MRSIIFFLFLLASVGFLITENNQTTQDKENRENSEDTLCAIDGLWEGSLFLASIGCQCPISANVKGGENFIMDIESIGGCVGSCKINGGSTFGTCKNNGIIVEWGGCFMKGSAVGDTISAGADHGAGCQYGYGIVLKKK